MVIQFEGNHIILKQKQGSLLFISLAYNIVILWWEHHKKQACEERWYY